jgi:small subunit ribosomal protein S2
MTTLHHKDLLKAGVHLGHLSRKWNPHMAPFIFMESHGIHIIDLNKTLIQLQEAADALQAIARAGKKILFVATKKQAKELVTQTAKRLNMPYMTERWLGGTLTNFVTIRRLIKKLTSMDRMMKSATYKNMAKKEQLMLARDKAKLERDLGGILELTKLPGALVVVDILKEHIAVQEANKLGIPVVALTDTNVNPDLVDYPIPSNDDATPAISILMQALEEAIAAGLAMRQEDKVSEALDTDKDAADDQDLQSLQDTASNQEDFLDEVVTLEDVSGKGTKNKVAEPIEKLKTTKLKEDIVAKEAESAAARTLRPRKKVREDALKSTHRPTTSKPTAAKATASAKVQATATSNKKTKDIEPTE